MNQKGFSLVQVVIAGGLAAAIGLFVAQVSQQASKSAASFRQQIALAYMKKEIQMLMADPDSCQATLTQIGGTGQVGDSFPDLKHVDDQGVPHTLYSTGTVYEGITLKSMVLTDQRAGDSNALPDDQRWLKITLDRSQDDRVKLYGAKDQDLYIRLHITRDVSGPGPNYPFEGCASEDSVDNVKRICQGYGAVYNDATNTCDIIGIDGVIACPTGQHFKGLYIATNYNGENVYRPICSNTL